MNVAPRIEIADKNAYAIVVGVGAYQNSDISRLDFTRADAQAFFDLLVDPKGVGLPPDNVHLLLDERATLVNIKRAITSWLASRATDDSTVIVFFAGHGGQEADRLGRDADARVSYLLPWDAHPEDLFSTALANDDFNKLLRVIRARRTVVFLDACHSGGVARQGSRDIGVGNLPNFEQLAAGEGRVVVSAAKPNQRSWEDPGLGHGIFTYHLLEALRGKADLNDDGYVSINDAISYLQHQVPHTVRRLGKEPQDPYLVSEGSGEIMLAVDPEKIARRLKESSEAEQARQKRIKDQCVALEKFWKDGTLSDAVFLEAVTVLKNDPDTYSRLDRALADNLESLLRGGISIETYLNNRKFIRGESDVRPKPSTRSPAPDPPRLRFCTQCGTPLRPGNLFCSSCGKRLG
jgi:hypothetical protein